MAKQKSFFSCNSCTYQTIKWLGCCPECNSWNSFVEEKEEQPAGPIGFSTKIRPVILTPLDNVQTESKPRMFSGVEEWDRVVGGGIMPSSLLILTGDPGIGKSTLLLQLSAKLAHNHKTFYFSTEESLAQVKQRAQRLNCGNSNLLFSDNADLASIIATAEEEKPDILILDSIQNCYTQETTSFPGSINQLRQITFHLMRLAKEHDITVIASGHITKEGTIAGPKTLEHMVDGVFYLQGEDRWQTRILRSVKNRFGTVNEIGFFQMEAEGLCEVPNINEHLINEMTHAPGSALISVIEGSRPLLLELQALTIETKLSIPQRVISGIDHKQVVLIAAILEKYLHIRLSSQDIFFKISGGFKIKDSSTDLGIALALLSSYFQQPLPEKSIALGEISLTGDIKPVNQVSILIREAQKFGINQLFIAKHQKIEESQCPTKRFTNVYELLSLFKA